MATNTRARAPHEAVHSIVRRPRWTEEQAAAVLRAADKAGLSLRGFAALHGLDPQRLYRWRRELRGQATQTEAVRFEEVLVRSADAARSASPAAIDLVLRSGHVVRLGSV